MFYVINYFISRYFSFHIRSSFLVYCSCHYLIIFYVIAIKGLIVKLIPYVCVLFVYNLSDVQFCTCHLFCLGCCLLLSYHLCSYSILSSRFVYSVQYCCWIHVQYVTASCFLFFLLCTQLRATFFFIAHLIKCNYKTDEYDYNVRYQTSVTDWCNNVYLFMVKNIL